MQAGLLLVDSAREGKPGAAAKRRGEGTPYVLAVLVGLLAAGLAGSAEIVLQINRWPRNPDCEPDVVGPGDRVRIHFPDQVLSLNGFWTGTVTAKILNAEALGLEQDELPAFTRQSSWHEAIQDKRNQREQLSSIWAEVVVPPEPDLAWQTLQMRFIVEVRYPTADRLPPQPSLFYFFYDEADQSVTHMELLHLACPMAGRWYGILAVGGMWLGTCLFVLQTLWLIKLARELKDKGNSTTIVASD